MRTYSSGMQSKLGFAITAILKTDIILVDEVLSVGDSHFKKKSFAKMQELISEKTRTVVIVSHNAPPSATPVRRWSGSTTATSK